MAGILKESGQHPQRALVHRSLGPVNNSLVVFAEGRPATASRQRALAAAMLSPPGRSAADLISWVGSESYGPALGSSMAESSHPALGRPISIRENDNVDSLTDVETDKYLCPRIGLRFRKLNRGGRPEWLN